MTSSQEYYVNAEKIFFDEINLLFFKMVGYY